MRPLIETLAGSFHNCLDLSAQLLDRTNEQDLYRRPRELHKTLTPFSIGEYLLRSAAAIEQTFNGITTRLWDDPFEWTLPEKLATHDLVSEYLDEVRQAVNAGFSFIGDDGSLVKELPGPIEMRSIGTLLVDTLARAEHYQGRAFAVFQMLSDEKLPRHP